MRPRRSGWFLLALALGLISHTCAQTAGAEEAKDLSKGEREVSVDRDGSYEESTRSAGLVPQLGPLTPSQYIRDFVDSVARGKADALLDSGEDLRPENMSKNASHGFEQYWPGGDWIYTKAELEFCNTTENCNIIYQKYGQVCAIDHLSLIHETFNTMCEMLDSNCRDGTFTTWTHTKNDTTKIQWFRVSKSGVSIKLMSAYQTHVLLAPAKNLDGLHYVFTLGYKQTNIALRDTWDRIKTQGLLSFYYYPTYHIINSSTVAVNYLEWNGTTGWVRWTVKSPRVLNTSSVMEYLGSNNVFEVKYLGLLGGKYSNPAYWELMGLARGWNAVYRGPCKDELATVPTEVPSRMKDKLDIEMYNFAVRLDEFGYNYTRVPCKWQWKWTWKWVWMCI